MRRVILCALLIAGVAAATGRTQEAGGYFQQFVHYTIRARLDTEQHMLTGSESIAYTNNSPDTLFEFYLHLYPNAYRNKNTPFMRDYRKRYNINIFELPEEHRGWLEIASVQIDGAAVTANVRGTIARMKLTKPLPPGASMTVTLDFESKIRKHLGRSGYRGNHYDMAQWYPKVVVYDEDGFHPDQFMTGEFYGEFGTFDVHLEVPENYVIAATGVVADGDAGWGLNSDGKTAPKKSSAYKKVHFHAENVHDFAWNADPTFVVQDTTWNGVQVLSFYRRFNKAWKDSTLAHGIRALEWLTEKVGPYPYPQVSIVDGLLRGGMEYPMLVMDGRASESLVLHEVGHIYFYGILGNDERAEAWLDEGLTSFQTEWYMMNRYGKEGHPDDTNWYQGLTGHFDRFERRRNALFPLLRLGYGERISTRSEEFEHSYRRMVYDKAALMFKALQYTVGEETFTKILQEYYSRWRLKHVNEARFVAVCEEVSGRDLEWFFGQWLHSRKTVDYELADVKTNPSASGDAYTTRVHIKRLNEMVMPLELNFTFKNGTTQRVRLGYEDARLRTIIREFDFPAKPTNVSLNADNDIMDLNLSNNMSPRRRALDINWPNSRYYPEDAYQFRFRPEGWYNHVDRAKLGLRIDGSYARWSRRFWSAFYYGLESGRFDYRLGVRRPLKVFWNHSELEMSMYKMEGREDFTLQLDTYKRSALLRPPTHRLRVGANYHGMRNASFIPNPEAWEVGKDFSYYVFYSVAPQADLFESKYSIGLRGGKTWFGTNYDYTSFTSEFWLRTREDLLWVDTGLRVFFGHISGDMPFQRKWSLAGGGPLEEEKHFWLRSPGANWEPLHYHVPGHGNIRGYFEGSFGVNRLITANMELSRTVPLLSKKPNRWLGHIKAAAFADIGKIFDPSNPIGSSSRVQALVDDGILNKGLFSAGAGLRVHRMFPFWDLRVRFDVPFYVNRPEVNGEKKETQYRYLLSIESLF